MGVLLVLMGMSLALSLLITPVCRGAALRWNFVDLPDNVRKIHRYPIPRIGGVPVFLACFGSCLTVAVLSAHNGVGLGYGFGAVKALAPAAALVLLIGITEDIVGLKPWQRLVGETVAGAIVVSAGVQIREIAGFTLHPWLGAIGTILWLLACTNAVNLIDGVDGLASGVALFASGTAMVASLLDGHIELAVAIAPLTGALLGFLAFNFNPASIFLGDSGSLMLGFLLGCYSILWSEKSATILGMTAPLIALAIPLLDTSIAIARRFLRRKPIFGADRSHIHHRLLARGFTPRRAVSPSIWPRALRVHSRCASAGCVTGGRVSSLWSLFAESSSACINWDDVEFRGARRLVLNGAFRRVLNAQLAVQSFEEELSAAVTPQECWAAIQNAAQEFGFHQMRMQLAGESFECHNGFGPIRSWAIRIPISKTTRVELSHEFGPAGHSTSVVAFVETIRNVLGSRSSVFARADQVAGIYSTLVH